jgi:hypothetical protein
MKKRETPPPKARLGLKRLREDYDEVVRLRQEVQAAESKLSTKSGNKSKQRQASTQRRHS